MQVILLQDIPNLGKKNELKQVAPGYARNHLLPRNLAVEATPQKLREWKQQREKLDSENRHLEEQARKQAEKMAGREFVFKMPAGEGGRLFGSVTPADIALKFEAEGFRVDKKRIEISEPIKSLGLHVISIRLHPGVKTDIALKVIKEE